jgi:hypothetical protein
MNCLPTVLLSLVPRPSFYLSPFGKRMPWREIFHGKTIPLHLTSEIGTPRTISMKGTYRSTTRQLETNQNSSAD